MAKRKKPLDEQGQDNENDNLNDDSFGLPDLDYKPLDSTPEETTTTTTTTTETTVEKEDVTPEPVAQNTYTETKTEKESKTTYTSPYMEEEEDEYRSRTPVIIGIVIAIAVAVAGVLFFYFVYQPQQENKERLAREAADLRAKEEAAAREKALAEEAARKRVADSLALANAKPAIGTIETLTERTKRYYVVVTSAVDGDLVMDYAKRLSAKGISTKIIPPFGKYKFSRLAIGDYDSFATAQAGADAAKNEFGGSVWVLKF